MIGVFNITRRSDDCLGQFDILAEVLEVVFNESNYPLYGSLLIGAGERGMVKKLLEVHVGTNDGDNQSTFKQNLNIYADLCMDVMKTLHKATMSRKEPAVEGLQHINRGNPRSFYLRIGKIPFYMVYFATYADESTGREIERIYLAIMEILRQLFAEDEHVEAITGEVINELLSQEGVIVCPDYQDTMTVIVEELARKA